MYEEQSAITCFPLFTVVTVSKFQALIGIHQTNPMTVDRAQFGVFQALIGIHQTYFLKIWPSFFRKFQALIGIHQTRGHLSYIGFHLLVSSPYRYSPNFPRANPAWWKAAVSSPYRYSPNMGRVLLTERHISSFKPL